MNALTAIVVLIPSVLSCVVTVCHLYWDYKKTKEPPKDEAWESAVRVLTADKMYNFSMDDFLEMYAQFRFMREHWEEIRGHRTLEEAIIAYNKAKESRPPDTK